MANHTLRRNYTQHLSPTHTVAWLTLAYAWVLAYITLHPLATMRWLDINPLGFVFKAWSKVGITAFDVTSNIIAYIPLGMGLAWCLLRVCPRPWQALLAALLVASLWSLGLESLQTYSPSRVASSIDWACNSAGALLGAVVATTLHGRLQWLRRMITVCLAPKRGAIWAVLGLWGLAQLHPQDWALMTAPLSFLSSVWLPSQGLGVALTAVQLRNLETIACVVALTGFFGMVRLGLSSSLPVWGRMLCMALAAVGVAVVQMGIDWAQYGWGEWRLLASAGAMDAMPPVLLMLLAWTVLPVHWVAVATVLALALQLALAQMLPSHPYTSSAPLWQSARLVHLYSLSGLLSAVWPLLALTALVLQFKSVLQRNPYEH